jgi:hypothetical protein
MLRKRATWNIVLKGDDADTINFVEFVEGLGRDIEICRADVSISFALDNDPTNPKSEIPKKT